MIDASAPTLLADDPDALDRDTQGVRAWLAAHEGDLRPTPNIAG